MKIDVEIESETNNRLRKSLTAAERDLKSAKEELIISRKHAERMKNGAIELQDEL